MEGPRFVDDHRDNAGHVGKHIAYHYDNLIKKHRATGMKSNGLNLISGHYG